MKRTWKVLVVDDEPDVHVLTGLVLTNLECRGRPVELIKAYNAEDAKDRLVEHPDIALALIDCVMESDYSGLELVQHIRFTLGNKLVRVILRTGQGTFDTEESIIEKYDINGYREKSDLSAANIRTMVLTAVAQYHQVSTLDCNRRALEMLVRLTPDLLCQTTIHSAVSAALRHIVTFLQIADSSTFIEANAGFVVEATNNNLNIISYTTGNTAAPMDARALLSDDVLNMLDNCLSNKSSVLDDAHLILYLDCDGSSRYLFYIGNIRNLEPWEQNVIEVYLEHISKALKAREA